MKKIVLCLALLIFLGGEIYLYPVYPKPAQDQPTTSQVSSPAATTKKEPVTVFSELRDKAKSRGIRFLINCNEYEESYNAWAIPPGAKFELYVKDGAKDDWFKSGFPTPERAAAWLLTAIDDPPNMRPQDEPKPKPKIKCHKMITSESNPRDDGDCTDCNETGDSN